MDGSVKSDHNMISGKKSNLNGLHQTRYYHFMVRFNNYFSITRLSLLVSFVTSLCKRDTPTKVNPAYKGKK